MRGTDDSGEMVGGSGGRPAPDDPTTGHGGHVEGETLETPETPETPPEYEILGELGRGAMGVVLRARHRVLHRLVALKVITVRSAGDPEEIARFLREARSLARLEHHNLVRVHDAGIHGRTPWVEMELVDGESLEAMVARGPLPVDVVLRIFEQLARGLAHTHSVGVIHRDVKPSNLLVTRDGLAKLVDFGLARDAGPADELVTQPGVVLGTPAYMAPEQWRGDPVDARTDLYALGVSLYQALTGRLPHDPDPRRRLREPLERSPPSVREERSDAPAALDRVLARLLAPRPCDRYPDAGELAADLRAMQYEPQGGSPPGGGDADGGEVAAEVAVEAPAPRDRPRRTGRPGRRRRSLAPGWIGAVAGLVVVGLDLLGLLAPLELWTLDARFAALGRETTGESPVAVVLKDRESRSRLAPGRALSRARHYGDLLAELDDLGARATVLDLLFTEASDPAEDGHLAAMTAVASSVVHAVGLIHPRGGRPVPQEAEAPPSAPVPGRWCLAIPPERCPSVEVLDPPFGGLAASTARAGHVSLAVDADRVHRRVPMLFACRGQVLPSLSLAAVMAAFGVDGDAVTLTPGGDLAIRDGRGGTLRIPLDAERRMLVTFRGARGEEGIRLPLWKVLSPEPGSEAREVADAVRGRVAFIGSSIPGDYDVGAIPGDVQAPLVWVHARAADTILRERFVEEVRPGRAATVSLLAVLLAALLGSRPRALAGAAVLAVLMAGYVAAALLAFGPPGVAWPLVAPLAAAGAAYLAGLVARLSLEGRERRRLALALGRYLSPRVSERLLDGRADLELGGKRKELTLLFAVLPDFAEVSERLEPEEVDEFLGIWHEAVSTVLFRHEGTLDRFAGEEVRAFFGDPEPQPDHAERAIRCAGELRREADRIARRWGRGRPTFGWGIAVHTAYVTVGNIGSRTRMEYTVVGTGVATAARLARHARGRVLATARTRSLAGRIAEFGPPEELEEGLTATEVREGDG